MTTTRSRVVHVYGNGRADAQIFAESLGEAIGLMIGLGIRFLILGSRAVVAAVRGDP